MPREYTEIVHGLRGMPRDRVRRFDKFAVISRGKRVILLTRRVARGIGHEQEAATAAANEVESVFSEREAVGRATTQVAVGKLGQLGCRVRNDVASGNISIIVAEFMVPVHRLPDVGPFA